MKKLSLLFVISIILFSAFPNFVSGQYSESQVTCYGDFKITDNNPGDYYVVYLRVITLCPTTSNWSLLYVNSTVYPVNLGVSLPYDGTQTSPVGIPEEETYYFYSIWLIAYKYVGGNIVDYKTRSSYAARSSLTLTANDEIVLSFDD